LIFFVCQQLMESVRPDTGEVIHIYATKKTPLTLIAEYAKEGCFAADDVELDDVRPVRQPSRSSYLLPDDGSRVTAIFDDYITVTEKDGTILNVFSFPSV
jgi:hypothetical protein